MAEKLPSFTQEEMAIEEAQGFPKAYALLCKTSTTISPFLQGPPFSFLPNTLKSQEALRLEKLNQMFPIIDSEARPSSNPRNYATFLWDQLDDLGAAGFDPALFRVDAFGNVIYLNADSVSPLAWDIDHWFPCSRGGKTVPSNLRILQWQVCKENKNKLDFLVPWWDLQLGVSVNQFLSTLYSTNLDFRRRALTFLFPNVRGGDEANCSEATVLTAVDLNRFSEKNHSSAEDLKNNSCAAVSLSQINETRRKLREEIHKLEEELAELKQKNEIERIELQELELALIRTRRNVEKCRSLAEAQASYKSILEKMIKDAMHQTIVYKEQLKLNQAASSALMARLEAQTADCDSSEKELRRKYKQRHGLEMQAEKACFEQTRKSLQPIDELNKCSSLLSSTRKEKRPVKKELRVFLEEQKAYELSINLSFSEENELKEKEAEMASFTNEYSRRIEGIKKQAAYHCDSFYNAADEKNVILDGNRKKQVQKIYLDANEAEESMKQLHLYEQEEENEEFLIQEGKKIVEKWLRILVEDSKEDDASFPDSLQSQRRLDQLINTTRTPIKHHEITDTKKMQILGTKNQELMAVNMLKQSKDWVSGINTKEYCRRIKGKEKQAAYCCDSSYVVEDEKDVILDGNMIKQVQKRDLDASQAEKSMKQWNLYEQEKENEELLSRVGEKNVEKWLQILLEDSKEENASFPNSIQYQRRLDQLMNTTSTPLKHNEITNSQIMQILGTKDQELMAINNKLKQSKDCELSVNIMNTKEYCRIKGKKKHTTYHCGSSYNAENEKAVILDGNMIKQVQNKDLDASQTKESTKQWNLYEQKEENDEFLNQRGKENVEKWLRILLEDSKEEDTPFPDSLHSQRRLDQLKNTTSTPIKEIGFQERLKEKTITGISRKKQATCSCVMRKMKKMLFWMTT